MSGFKNTIQALSPQDRRKTLEDSPLEHCAVYAQVTRNGSPPADATAYHPGDMQLEYGMAIVNPQEMLQRKRKLSEDRNKKGSAAELEHRLRHALEDYLRPFKRARHESIGDGSSSVPHTQSHGRQPPVAPGGSQQGSPSANTTRTASGNQFHRPNTPIVISATPSPLLQPAKPQMPAASISHRASQASADMSQGANGRFIFPNPSMHSHALQNVIPNPPPVVNFGKPAISMPQPPQRQCAPQISVPQASNDHAKMPGNHYQQRPGPTSRNGQHGVEQASSCPRPQHPAEPVKPAMASALHRPNEGIDRATKDVQKPGDKTGQPLSNAAQQVVNAIGFIPHVPREGIRVPQRKDLKQLSDFDHNGLLRATSPLWHWRWDEKVCPEAYWQYLLVQPTRATKSKPQTSRDLRPLTSSKSLPSVPVSPGQNPGASAPRQASVQMTAYKTPHKMGPQLLGMSGQMNSPTHGVGNRKALQLPQSSTPQRIPATPSAPGDGRPLQHKCTSNQATMTIPGKASSVANMPKQFTVHGTPDSTPTQGPAYINQQTYSGPLSAQAPPNSIHAAPRSQYNAQSMSNEAAAYISPPDSSAVSLQSPNMTGVAVPGYDSRSAAFALGGNINAQAVRGPSRNTGTASPGINATSPMTPMSNGVGYFAGAHANVHEQLRSIPPQAPTISPSGQQHYGLQVPSNGTIRPQATTVTPSSQQRYVLQPPPHSASISQETTWSPSSQQRYALENPSNTASRPQAITILPSSQQRYVLQRPSTSATFGPHNVSLGLKQQAKRSRSLAELQMLADAMRATGSQTQYGGVTQHAGLNDMAPPHGRLTQQSMGGRDHWNNGTPLAGTYGWPF